MNEKVYVKMFTNCIVTKGVNRSLILDIQRNSFEAIPDTMQEIIEEFKSKKTIEEVYLIYGLENKIIIDEYIDYLIENDFAFLAENNEFDSFFDMDTNFEIPAHLSNCIIEISAQTKKFINKTLLELDSLFCKNLQLICYQELSIENLKLFLKATKNSNLRSIEVSFILPKLVAIDGQFFMLPFLSIAIFLCKQELWFKDSKTLSLLTLKYL